jgi:hypothetical protein
MVGFNPSNHYVVMLQRLTLCLIEGGTHTQVGLPSRLTVGSCTFLCCLETLGFGQSNHYLTMMQRLTFID